MAEEYLLADQPSELERLRLQSLVWEPSGRQLLAKLDDGDRGVRYLERPVSLRESVIDMLAMEDVEDDRSAPTDAFAVYGRSESLLAAALADLRTVLAGPRIQVRCLECASDAPPPARSDRGFLAALLEWLS